MPRHDGEPPEQLYILLAELDEAGRALKLAALERASPPLAARMRSLLDIEADAGDFLSVLGQGQDRPAPPEALVSAGDLAGPYRLLRPLGHGGMGEVWLADDERLQRQVALKLFRAPAARGDGEARGMMLAEGRAAARLEHPHVAVVYDVGETPAGVRFMAMAYYEGGSLADRLARGALALEPALAVASQLTQALGAAHHRGLLHRDVKPANVLFDGQGGVKLADFGIATLLGADGESPLRAGTLPYTAPEVLLGGRADHRADLWSLGVTFYEMLARVRPFGSGSSAGLIFEILAEQPAPLPGHLGAPPELDRLIASLLEKDPERRPASSAEVEQALHEVRRSLERQRQLSMLPEPLTSIIGRSRLINEVADSLADCRLVTLTGPAGVGKTRLAIEVARTQACRYAEGASFVSLAALDGAEQVPKAIAQGLGLQESGVDSVDDQVTAFCARPERLLVLDNCEQFPGASRFLARLLQSAPDLHLLATSRGPLRIVGEREIPVPPLELDSVDAAGVPGEAVQLFIQRAAADPSFSVPEGSLPVFREICRRLDGLPLAIELAAARIRTMEPDELLLRVKRSAMSLRSLNTERPERHRTLRDAIGWSYNLLGEDDRQLLQELALFSEGFWGDAVADAEGLASLVDANLVLARRLPDGIQFSLLETIRDYGMEQLRASGQEVEARRRHAARQVALTESVAAALAGPKQATWHARLRQDEANLRSTLEFLIQDGDLMGASQFAVALHRHWLVSGGYRRDVMNLLARLEEAIRQAPPSTIPDNRHADVLLVLGSLAGARGDHFSVPYRYYEAGLARYRHTRNSTGQAMALGNLGWVSMLLGRYPEATEFSNRALRIHRRRPAGGGLAAALVNLGWVELSRSRYRRAERRFTEALEIQRRLEDRRSIAYAMGHLGTTWLCRGEPNVAREWYRKAGGELELLHDRIAGPTFAIRCLEADHAAGDSGVDVHRLIDECIPAVRDSGHVWSLAFGLALLGRIRLDSEQFDLARAPLDESLRLRKETGLLPGVADSQALLGRLDLAQGRFAQAARRLSSSLRTRQDIGEPLGQVECCEAIAEWLLARQDSDTALMLLTGAARVRRRLGARVTPRYRGHRTALLARAREALRGHAPRARNLAERLSLDALVRLALARLPT